jgi:hypothetical protein
MQQSWVRALALLWMFVCAAGADAQTPPCTEDRLFDRCDPEQHRRVLELFGMPPIETHHEAEDWVRRAFYVDGYGNDVVAISFIRTRGREPFVSVHVPRRDGGPAQSPLIASVPQDVWVDVLRRSTLFDRELVPPRPDNSGWETICLHPWVWTVEGTDPPPDVGPRTGIRRKVQNSCDYGPAGQFADELAIAALSLLSYCRSLDLADYRSEGLLLAECFKLHGDRNAAAVTRNRVADLQYASDFGQPSAMGLIFASDAVMELNGNVQDAGEPEDIWSKQVWGPRLNGTFMTVDAVEAESAARVTVVGTLSRSWPLDPAEPDGPSRRERARVELRWTAYYDTFELARVSIGPFEAEPQR